MRVSAVSRRGQVFASVCLFSYLVNFGRVSFAPLVEPFMRIFEVGPGTAGAVASAVWLGSALTRLPTGWLLTRVRRHHAILGMGVFLVGAALFTASAPSVTLVAAGALLVGLASGVFYIAANPLVTELYPDRVGWAVGIRGMSSQLAAVSAPVLVGVALATASWRAVFYGIASLALVATAVLAVAARRTEMPEAGAEDRDLLGAAREQWRLILTGIALLGTTGFVWQGMFNFYVSYLTAVKGIPQATATTLLTAVFAAGVPAFFLSGRLSDRFPYVPYILSILGGFVVAAFALTVVSSLAAVAVVSLAMGYVIHSFFPALDTYLLASFPDRTRASAYATYSATMMLMQAPGSAAFGALLDAGYGYTAVIRGALAGLVVVFAGMFLLYRIGRVPTGESGHGPESGEESPAA
jgi:predicted MFS family arabinose efflux permease